MVRDFGVQQSTGLVSARLVQRLLPAGVESSRARRILLEECL